MKIWKVVIFNGFINYTKEIYASSYELAVKSLGIFPPAYIWHIEPITNKKGKENV